ncbi:wax ester/triacylglycerol synthase family O-acyltransferase [Kineosporia sp. A_224]|uniref:WS/DGAT/MGAT family O-acyltransferase n=1 Tax=Kineosporia sp. A_224 TaxID=1962180 RepID=UPI000B4AAC13|nr:wax ester/triacylglycerol synthase family O-acyltransferase [Kineosporia sp. A_224]
MQQLTGLDALFLAMESPEVNGHVGSVCVLDPSTAPRPLTRARLTAHVASRLHLLPLLRRSLRFVPLGLDQPYWVDDEPVLKHHVRQVRLPRPGGDHELATTVARLHAQPLDRSRPLWELYLVTGLRGGRVAVYSKVHHASMDGVSGDDVLTALLDGTASGRVVAPADGDPPPDEVPRDSSLVVRSLLSLLRQPARVARVSLGLLVSVPGLVAAGAARVPVLERVLAPEAVLPYGGLRAPHTPFNASISADRAWAFADLSLADVKRVKEFAGLTVNDVVLAVCAGALRRWLLAHDALPDDPLVAAIPVSLRSGAPGGPTGNQLSVILTGLPTNVGTPLDRLLATASAMRAGKAEMATFPPTMLGELSGLALPLVADPGWRLWAHWRLMERINPFNLFVSNVPGPRETLYYAGAELVGYYPASSIIDGQGLNITAMSYRDRICFGLLGCPTLVPDVEQLAAWLGDELHALLRDTVDREAG